MQKLLYSLPDAGNMLGGIKKNLTYKLVRERELELVKLGSRSFITAESIAAYVERQRLKRAS